MEHHEIHDMIHEHVQAPMRVDDHGILRKVIHHTDVRGDGKVVDPPEPKPPVRNDWQPEPPHEEPPQ